MADFRKWLLAFAVVALLLGLGTSASAQIPQTAPITCTANQGVPRQVRAEGVAELLGDVVLNCTGGTPTPAGQPVPLSNIRVALSVPLTSRVFDTGTGASEALLLIDEPFPSGSLAFPGAGQQAGSPSGQIGCLAKGGQTTTNPYVAGTTGICDIKGIPHPAANPGETYSGQYNVFQGITTAAGGGVYYIDFLGVPIDAPGTTAERIIRIANLRGDMTKAAGNIAYATLSVSGNTNLTLPNPSTTVAFSYPGFNGQPVGAVTETQCAPASGSVSIAFTEGFASSFKTRLITDADQNGTVLNAARTDIGAVGNDTSGHWRVQNEPAVNYYTESGLTPTFDSINGVIASTTNQTSASPASIGVADYGTRFRINVFALQSGVVLTFPGIVSNGLNLTLYRVDGAASDGTGGTVVTTGTTITGDQQPGVAVGTPVSTHVTGQVFYEVVSDDPNLVETAQISAGVSYIGGASPANNTPALALQSGNSISWASASFAPIAADVPGLPLLGPPFPNSNTNGSLPRFVVTQAPGTAVNVVPCSCNLLFPWVVNDGQFDTGIAVVNTSRDPWGDAQTGTVTLYLYGAYNGVTPISPQVTLPASGAVVVPPGCAYIFSLNNGPLFNNGINNCEHAAVDTTGNATITAAQVQMFSGYMIAHTTFQYCHGLAFVSEIGAAGPGSFYEAIQLDEPFNLRGIDGATSNSSRTKQWGENDGH